VTSQRELDRLLGAFLSEGADEVADRVIDAALDEIDHTRQRRATRMPWGYSTMSSTARMLASVAAVAVVGVLAVGAVIVLARPDQPAAGGPASATPAPASTSAAGLVVPGRVLTAGTVTWCTDVSYPPGESYAADGTTPEGFDIDIAAEIARRWGVTSEIRPTGWDALLPTLQGNGCDLVISSMTSTFDNRVAKADFVDYLRPWTAFVVAAGNPKGISTLDDVAGKAVGVEASDPLTPAALEAASADLVAAGKTAIVIVKETQSEEAWIEDLVSGKVDALAGDSLHAAYHVALPPYAGAAEISGPAIDPQPIGIAVRKDDEGMKEAVAAAIDAIYADGTMKSIVEKWGIADAVELLR
jgi:polar amino acid transport system substrate-binding protein